MKTKNVSHRLLLFAALIAVIALVGLLAPMPVNSRAADCVADFLHLPAFALLAWLALKVSDRFVSSVTFTRILTTLFVIFVSACVELLQARIGRTASLHDLAANSTGAIAALLIHQSIDSKPLIAFLLRILSIGLSVYVSSGPVQSLIDVARQHHSPALLAPFASSVELERWYIDSAQVRIIHNPVTNHQSSAFNTLEVVFKPGKFPAVQLQQLTRDWTPYTSLAFDLSRAVTDTNQPLVIQLRITSSRSEQSGEGTVTRRYTLLPGDQRQCTIPLGELLERGNDPQLALERIRFVEFMAVDLKQAATIQLAKLRLLGHDN